MWYIINHFPTIILGIYLTFVIKDYEYILTLIKYSIILSSIILYFFSLDIILPKNIEKINYKVSNNSHTSTGSNSSITNNHNLKNKTINH